MEIDLTDDQVLFHDTTVRFIEAELPVAATRRLHDDPAGYDRSWLRRGAAIGWFAMFVPDEHGGGSVSASPLVDAAIVAEEMGRHVQPGPFIPMYVVAGAVAAHGVPARRRELLPPIVSGDVVATWACADRCGNWDDGAGLRRSGRART